VIYNIKTMKKIHPVRSSLAKVPTGLTPLARSRLLTGQKLIVIVGPTASGKSDLGIKLAKKFNGEIISADSRQVYRGMDIGTGKVSKDEYKGYKGHLCKTKMPFVTEGIRHYLVDVASPKRVFTASDFKRLGEKAIKEISAKNKIPIIVGGTGFYIDILLNRIQLAEVPPNPTLRAQFDKLTVKKLFEKLEKLDPQRSKTIDRYNKHRLIRALEIALYINSRPKTHNLKPKTYSILWLGINPGKEMLAKRIKTRLDARLEQEMIEEVSGLHKDGVSWKRLDEFGLEYRYVSRYLKQFSIFNFQFSKKENKKFKKTKFYDQLLREIIKYSKRQMTWFTQLHPWEKNNPKEIHWIKSLKEAERFTRTFLKRM